jgi:general secretion pathway protein H
MSRAGNSGFTLIELLVTLALTGLLLALVPPLLDKGGDRARLDHDRRQLTAQLRLARSVAIAGDRTEDLLIDAGLRRFGLDKTDLSFSKDVSVAVEGSTGEAGLIRFFPDGSSSGALIRLSNRAGETALAVDWLTGAVGPAP